MPSNVTSNRELRQRRWLKRIETLLPQMIEKADQEGGIVVAQLGKKHLPDGRVVEFAACYAPCTPQVAACAPRRLGIARARVIL